MRYLRMIGRTIDLFKDPPDFSKFQATLDGEMKRQSLGLGSKKWQAEIITEEEEELLWSKGALGDETPQQLRILDTIVSYNGLYFALRGGKEHRQLRHAPCLIEIVEKSGERPFRKYTEDVSKNHQGGPNPKSSTITQMLTIHNGVFFASLSVTWNSALQMLLHMPFIFSLLEHHATTNTWFSNRPLAILH